MHRKKPIESCLATDNLKEAEKQLAIAVGKMGNYAGSGDYVGSLAEYRDLVKVFLRLQSISEKVEYGESKMIRRRRTRPAPNTTQPQAPASPAV